LFKVQRVLVRASCRAKTLRTKMRHCCFVQNGGHDDETLKL
jgi:hypothetical protein